MEKGWPGSNFPAFTGNGSAPPKEATGMHWRRWSYAFFGISIGRIFPRIKGGNFGAFFYQAPRTGPASGRPAARFQDNGPATCAQVAVRLGNFATADGGVSARKTYNNVGNEIYCGGFSI